MEVKPNVEVKNTIFLKNYVRTIVIARFIFVAQQFSILFQTKITAMNLSLTTKMHLFPKWWKQFGSFSSKKERQSETAMEYRYPFKETPNELEEDDGLRWDQYGNPYISSVGTILNK